MSAVRKLITITCRECKKENCSVLEGSKLCDDCEEKISCPVCMQRYTKVKRREIECPMCTKKVCLACIKQVMLDSGKTECMNCHKEFTTTFICEIASTTFFRTMFKIKQEKLFEMNKLLLPRTQERLDKQKQFNAYSRELCDAREKLYDTRIKLDQNSKKLQREKEARKKLRAKKGNTTNLCERIHRRIEDIKFFQSKINSLRRKCAELDRKMSELNISRVDAKEKEVPKYIMNCPSDDCRGFINIEGKCGLCNTKICLECREPENEHEEHKCDPDAVKTVKLLRKDTKPCPKCTVPIHKIDGCSQMWCVVCHIAFDWITGKIETGRIHNPHFYQFQRQQNGGVAPRVPGDNPCGIVEGRMPEIILVQSMFDDEIDYKIVDNIFATVLGLMRQNQHIYSQAQDDFSTATSEGLRTQYLLNKIDEKKWLAQFKRYHKQAEMNYEMNQIITMFTDTSIDITNRFIRREIEYYFATMNRLREYFNESMKTISKQYKLMALNIDSQWRFKRHKY